MRSVIKFLAHEGVLACDIRRRLVSAYGPDLMNCQNVAKRVRVSRSVVRRVSTNVHDKEKSGRPFLVSDDFIQKVDQIIREDRRRILDEIQDKCANIYRTILQDVITNQLDYRKLCARWVPKMLTEKKTDLRRENCFLSALM